MSGLDKNSTKLPGLFNLGSALAFVQVLPKGVYIAMNGQYFEAGKVIKNTSEGKFENK